MKNFTCISGDDCCEQGIRELGIQLSIEFCQRVLNGLRMPHEWTLSVVVQVVKGMVTSGTTVETEV